MGYLSPYQEMCTRKEKHVLALPEILLHQPRYPFCPRTSFRSLAFRQLTRLHYINLCIILLCTRALGMDLCFLETFSSLPPGLLSSIYLSCEPLVNTICSQRSNMVEGTPRLGPTPCTCRIYLSNKWECNISSCTREEWCRQQALRQWEKCLNTRSLCSMPPCIKERCISQWALLVSLPN